MLQPNLLKAAIVRAGLTQGEFRKRIGMSANAYANRMCGKTQFNIAEVDRTRQVLNIDYSEICDIFFGTNSQYREANERSV